MKKIKGVIGVFLLLPTVATMSLSLFGDICFVSPFFTFNQILFLIGIILIVKQEINE